MQFSLGLALVAFAISIAAEPQSSSVAAGSSALLPQALHWLLGPQLHPGKDACRWDKYQTASRISSWEFQLRFKQDMNRTRAEWQQLVERTFTAAQQKVPAFHIDRSSRRSMIWHETAHALTTSHARPLDPSAASGVRFPWRQAAVLRLRACAAVEAPMGAKRPRHLLEPGQADLTLKLKDVEDPQALPRYEEAFPRKVDGSWLQVKLENDVHCDYRHVSYSAVFRRTSGVTDDALRTLRGVRRFFPTLPGLLHLGEDFELPTVLDHWQSKTYWDVRFGAVRGTVQLYLNSTSREDALSGERATMMELSMRLARHDACDACRPRRLDAALQLIVQLCKELGRHGWQARPAASTEMGAGAEAASGRLEGQLGWQ